MKEVFTSKKTLYNFLNVDTKLGSYPNKIGTGTFALTLIRRMRKCGISISNLNISGTIFPVVTESKDFLYSVLVHSPIGERKFNVTLNWDGTGVSYEILFKTSGDKWELSSSKGLISLSKFDDEFSKIMEDLS